jgi:hypothetical protein
MLAAIAHLHHELDIPIIIRPHPSEAHEIYRSLFSAHEDIHVTSRGLAREWIAHASVVVHNSCTTGIESALMGVPTIAYQPVTDPRYDISLANDASRQVKSRDTLLEAVTGYLEDPSYSLSQEQREALHEYLNTDGPLAAHLITQHVNDLATTRGGNYTKLHPGYRRVAEESFKSIVPSDIIAAMYNKIIARVAPEEYRRRSYQTQKFPGLTQHEIADRAEALASISGVSSPSIKKVRGTANTFLLS